MTRAPRTLARSLSAGVAARLRPVARRASARIGSVTTTATRPVAPLSRGTTVGVGLAASAAIVGAIVAVVLAATGGGAAARTAHEADGPAPASRFLSQLADPSGSGLDPALAARLTAIAEKVVDADVTGQGRDAFPGYWPAGSYAVCCRAVQVRGAGARPSAVEAGDVDVTVIWDAERVDGGPALVGQQSIVRLRPTAEGWLPVPPASVTPQP